MTEHTACLSFYYHKTTAVTKHLWKKWKVFPKGLLYIIKDKTIYQKRKGEKTMRNLEKYKA